jgi:hypothetical protein
LNTTAIVLIVSPNPSTTAQSVTLTAEVAPTTATGTVTFYKGTTAIGSATLSAGTAVFVAPPFTEGTHQLRAIYNGDATDFPSTSQIVDLVVN